MSQTRNEKQCFYALGHHRLLQLFFLHELHSKTQCFYTFCMCFCQKHNAFSRFQCTDRSRIGQFLNKSQGFYCFCSRPSFVVKYNVFVTRCSVFSKNAMFFASLSWCRSKVVVEHVTFLLVKVDFPVHNVDFPSQNSIFSVQSLIVWPAALNGIWTRLGQEALRPL